MVAGGYCHAFRMQQRTEKVGCYKRSGNKKAGYHGPIPLSQVDRGVARAGL